MKKMEIYQPEEDSFFLSGIIEREIMKLSDKKNVRVLEIGCGSGVQLQTIEKKGVKNENIFSCDINPEAVKHCKKLGFNSFVSDLFEKIKGRFDLIVFNPPYLPESRFDKKKDTTGGKKGSEIINKFLRQAKTHLEKNGKMFLLTSSFTKGIKWNNYKKKLLGRKKLFFEELYVWELRR